MGLSVWMLVLQVAFGLAFIVSLLTHRRLVVQVALMVASQGFAVACVSLR